MKQKANICDSVSNAGPVKFRAGIERERIEGQQLNGAKETLTPIKILCFWTLSIALSLSKNRPVYFSKHNNSSSIDGAQLRSFYLKTETESSLRNVVF
jgi:hypothetical protein